MSRSSKSLTAPPSGGKFQRDPRESDPSYRKFLGRSLDRCDAELSALVDLNGSLSKVKQRIPDEHLLHMGQGLLKLGLDGDSLVVTGCESKSKKQQSIKEVAGELQDKNDKESNGSSNSNNAMSSIGDIGGSGGETKKNLNEEDKDVAVTTSTSTSNDNHEEEDGMMPSSPEMRAHCLDFLLHMKLRKRLLNRLARRIHRLNCAMDGDDVSPPGPPKYGDLRLNVDPKAVNIYAQHWKLQEKAKKTIEQARLLQKQRTEELLLQVQKEEEQIEATMQTETNAEEKEQHQDNGESNTDSNAKTEVVMDDQKNVKQENEPPSQPTPNGETPQLVPSTLNPTAAPDRPTPQNHSNTKQHLHHLKPEFDVLKDYKDAYEKEYLSNTVQTAKYTILDQAFEEDHASIRYGSGIGAIHRSMSSKEKEAEWNRWQHSLLGRIPDQPTFEELGLEHNVFFIKERLQRLKKKETKDEEGSNDMDDTNASSPKKTKKPESDADTTPKKSNRTPDGKLKKKADNGMDSDSDSPDDKGEADATDDMDESTTEEGKADDNDNDDADFDPETEHGKTGTRSKSHNMSPTQDSNKSPGKTLCNKRKKDDEDENDAENEKNGDDENDKEQEENPSEIETFKKRKQMSIMPVPSFYDQDRGRILMIHADLMANSMHEHARQRIADATNEYNATFRRSNDTYNRRVQVQTNLNNILYETRIKGSKLKNNYQLEVAIAKATWQKRKKLWEAQKLQALMPSYRGQVAIGTPSTASALAQQPDNAIVASVVSALANVVDACVIISESSIPIGKFEPFVPPLLSNPMSLIVDHKTGETFAQRQARLENSMRRDLQNLSARLGGAEDERKRAWRKMLKTRAEFEPPTTTKARRGVDSINNSWQHVPIPSLRASSAAVMPASFGYTGSSIPTYTPPAGSASRATIQTMVQQHCGAAHDNPLESKYSMAKVKERIAADGTVAPVSMPKKNRDGTYQRPAGRTRKGMEWDGVRGIWVPASSG